MLAYLSLGSNLGSRWGDPCATLALAVARLQRLDGLSVRRGSTTYRTRPMGLTEQPDFANLVVEVETVLAGAALLGAIQAVEREFGRTRDIPQGPRTLDVDLLLLGNFVIDEPGLVVPHPRLHLRRFVLVPLAELAPELMHPLLRRSVASLLAGLMATPGDVVGWAANAVMST